MTQICILNTNDFDIHIFDYNSLINSNEKIFNTYIDKYIDFKNVSDNDSLMKLIIDELNLNTQKFGGYTETIYETPNSLYQMIYVDIDDKNAHMLCKENEKIDNIKNMFACYLTSEKKNIHGKCILIKLNYDSNNKPMLCDITYDDIIFLLHRKIVHMCVHVNCNGNTIKNIRFLYNPCESDKLNKYEVHDTTFADITILIYALHEKQNKKYNLNEITNIICEKKIYDDVFISLLNYNSTFIDLDDDLFSKIIFIFNNKTLLPEINKTDKNDDEDDGKQQPTSQYRKILELYSKLDKFINKK